MKFILFFILRWTGVYRLMQYFHRNEIIIFSLHGVMKVDRSSKWAPLWNRVDPDIFELVLKYLKKRYSFITMDEAADIIEGKIPVRPYLMVLTFDDGYRNVLTHALPVMVKHAVPSMVYIATSYVGNTKPFFFDRLDYAIQNSDISWSNALLGKISAATLDGRDRNKLQRSYKNLLYVTSKITRDDLKFQKDINDIVIRLERKAGKSLGEIQENDDWSAILNWDEVLRARKKNVFFGSHTEDHIRLGRVREDTIRKQVVNSKKEVEKKTGALCDHFCFPNGSFSRLAKKIIKEAGYRTAVTVERGSCKVGDDLFSLKRYSFTYTCNEYELLNLVSGFSVHFKKIKSFFRFKVTVNTPDT